MKGTFSEIEYYYDDNSTFDMYVSYMSFIIIFSKKFVSVIFFHFCHNIFETVKELH